MRFQLGQSDRFREGIVRSGAWREHIAATFEKMGLPRELAALPHVESSFNTYAYSKVGAAGMWQFMRGTGRRFLRIDAAVDERLDPYRSTEAAARFLEQNYIVLGSWPLALTAYNHGPGGMRRAQEQLGTSDIVTIVRKYNSRSFGFASRNFYVAFLAALEIDSDPEKFFGPIRRNADRHQPRPRSARASCRRAGIATVLELDRDELRRLNPSLLPSVWRGARHVPRGFELRVPSTIDLDRGGRPALGAASATTRRSPRRSIASRSGETLSAIAIALRREHRGDRGTQQPRSSLSYSGRPGAGVARRARRAGAGRRRRVDRQDPRPPPAKAPTPPTGVVGTREPLRREARRHACRRSLRSMA